MKTSRFICLIAFAVATLFANGAGAAAPGCDTVVRPAIPASVSIPDAPHAPSSGHVPDSDILCAVECAQSGRALSQPVAAMAPESPSALATVGFVVEARFAVADLRVPPPPQVVGPPLTILFGNFRN